ncbi:MAG: hypothetical protein NT151_08000 [Acidobacteria bacterium]|nr:hypothetical protein [Acidobacteriota bacterium]
MRIANRLASAALVLAASACTTMFEVPVETPIKPKLDVAAFSRVFVAGFVAGGTEDVDANLETVRLLRNQLKNKSSLKVIDADVLPLREVAAKNHLAGQADPASTAPVVDLPKVIKEDRDLQAFEPLFTNAAYWKKIGEEFQSPLIVTGTVMFTPQATSGYVQREQEVYDTFGRRQVVPVRTYMERKGFILKPKFMFIDGRTGVVLYTETFREEVLYSAEQSNPALSTYFELMDRLVPAFLSTLSSQTIKGTRTLLK